MKPALFIFLMACLTVSCYEPFIPEINTREKVLVVDGLITDEIASYHVKLSYASPYDSTGTQEVASQASVYVKDQQGNIFFFHEGVPGDYATDSVQFRGQVGSTYWLFITTRDGTKYISDPQPLLASGVTDSVYAGFEERESLNQITGLIEQTHGGAIVTDIANEGDTLRSMRFVSRVVNQYWYNVCPVFQRCYDFYCWQNDDPNTDINLTDADNSTGTHTIRKHEICFVADNVNLYGMIYDYRTQGPDLPVLLIVTRQYQLYLVHTRIIYVDRYGLNQATSGFYKDMDSQLRSEGKLFDPIAVQLTGNISCSTQSDQRVLGFFEASSVVHQAFELDFNNLTNGQPTLTRLPYVIPPSAEGCLIDQVPTFWIP